MSTLSGGICTSRISRDNYDDNFYISPSSYEKKFYSSSPSITLTKCIAFNNHNIMVTNDKILLLD